MRSLLTLPLLAFALAGCCQKPWKAYPMPSAPDTSCETGGTHGYLLFIWDCYQDQRVVIYQFTAEMSCEDAARDTAPCGGKTEIELKLEEELSKGCYSVPTGWDWKVSEP